MKPRQTCLVLVILAACAARLSAADDAKDWVEPMKKVHARFTGTKGTFAQFGDSITVSLAYWAGLESEPRSMSPDAAKSYALVKKHMKPECWRNWRGDDYGSKSAMTIRWAHENVDKWLKKLNPEVALIMFGTNDLTQVDAKEYEQKLREVVEKCLKNGTVVILSTIPPRHGLEEKSKQYADIARKVGKELKVPILDFHAEVLKRRPTDWDGAAAKFKDIVDVYEVPTLISKDGVHPSNPQKFRDFSEESLRSNGFLLRGYLGVMSYADVLRQVLARGEGK